MTEQQFIKRQIKYCLMAYPGIFPNIACVLRHWFMVIGNGYGWHQGRLVEVCEGNAVTDEAIQAAFHKSLAEYDKRIAEHEKEHQEYKSPVIANALFREKKDRAALVLMHDEMDRMLGRRDEPIWLSSDDLRDFRWGYFKEVLRMPADVLPEWRALMIEYVDACFKAFNSERSFNDGVQLNKGWEKALVKWCKEHKVKLTRNNKYVSVKLGVK